MSSIQEIEQAVAHLSQEELRVFRAWFAEHDARSWDAQFEHDASRGKLDALADEALEDLRQGRSTDL
jgi:hypothetical protein